MAAQPLKAKSVELKVVDVQNTGASAAKTDSIDTPYGPCSYTVHGDLTKPALLTYHDIGLNHESCFSTFTNMLFQADPIFNQFCVVHIDAPGHNYEASEIPADTAHFEMEELAEHVENICVKLEIKRFVGVGVGAGGYVLMQHALQHPDRVMSLVLLGTSGRKCGWIEWATKWTSGNWKFKSDEWWRQWFLTRWFCQNTLDFNKDLLEQYWREIDRINPNNAYKYVQGFQRRRDLLPELSKLGCKVLLIVGDRTPLEAESIEILDNLPAATSELIMQRGTGMLVTAENPQALVEPLKLHLQGMGYV